MTFEEYQKFVDTTILNKDSGLAYPALGLCGESGEVAEKIKKVIRDADGVMSEEVRQELAKELGDVLWYLTRLSIEINIPIEEVAHRNVEKLSSRFKRNVVHGDGDNR